MKSKNLVLQGKRTLHRMATMTLQPSNDLSTADNIQDDDVQEMRKALASAQAEGRLAAQLGQQLIQQKKEFREKAHQETRELTEELKSVRESLNDIQLQIKIEREQNLILKDQIQQLETDKEGQASEIEHLKIKVQSVDLERKKALDDQERLIADLDAAEEDLLRLRRVELSLREERDRIQDKLDETRLSMGKNDDDLQALLDELEELRPLKHVKAVKDLELEQMRETLREEQLRSDNTIAESRKERDRMQNVIDDLKAALAETKTKNISALSASASKILGTGLTASAWGEVASGSVSDWGAPPFKPQMNLPLQTLSSQSHLHLPPHAPSSARGLGESVSHSASEEHGGDNCPCGAEHIKHVLAHPKRPQLKICETCQKHFCRRCSAYQIYGREYRQIDSSTVIDCYKCWISNGGSMASATEELQRAADSRKSRGDTSGIWREDSNASFFSDAGSEHGGSKIPNQIFAKVKTFMSGGLTPR